MYAMVNKLETISVEGEAKIRGDEMYWIECPSEGLIINFSLSSKLIEKGYQIGNKIKYTITIEPAD